MRVIKIKKKPCQTGPSVARIGCPVCLGSEMRQVNQTSSLVGNINSIRRVNGTISVIHIKANAC